MLNQLKSKFSKSVGDELTYFTNLNAIYIQLLFHNAEDKKVTLDIDTSQVENMHNMKQMEDLVNLLNSPNVPTDFSGKKNIGKLSSISSTQNLISDYEELLQNHNILNAEFNNLKKQNDLLSQENLNLKSNNNKFSNEMQSFNKQLEKLSGDNNKDSSSFLESIKKLERELSETKKNLDDQIDKYHVLTSEFNKKLSESTQFRELKKYLAEKNNLIIELKKKIEKYEGNVN